MPDIASSTFKFRHSVLFPLPSPPREEQPPRCPPPRSCPRIGFQPFQCRTPLSGLPHPSSVPYSPPDLSPPLFHLFSKTVPKTFPKPRLPARNFPTIGNLFSNHWKPRPSPPSYRIVQNPRGFTLPPFSSLPHTSHHSCPCSVSLPVPVDSHPPPSHPCPRSGIRTIRVEFRPLPTPSAPLREGFPPISYPFRPHQVLSQK